MIFALILVCVCVFVVSLVVVVFFFFLEGLSWNFSVGEKRKKKGISAFWFSFVELEL